MSFTSRKTLVAELPSNCGITARNLSASGFFWRNFVRVRNLFVDDGLVKCVSRIVDEQRQDWTNRKQRNILATLTVGIEYAAKAADTDKAQICIVSA